MVDNCSVLQYVSNHNPADQLSKKRTVDYNKLSHAREINEAWLIDLMFFCFSFTVSLGKSATPRRNAINTVQYIKNLSKCSDLHLLMNNY